MFTVLHNMALILKENTVSVPCTLVGFVYGFICLTLSTVTYTNLASMNLIILPVHPEPLNVVNNATQYQVTQAMAQHETATHTVRTYQLLQCALIQQVLEAIEAKMLMCNQTVTSQHPNINFASFSGVRKNHYQAVEK